MDDCPYHLFKEMKIKAEENNGFWECPTCKTSVDLTRLKRFQ